MSDFRVQLDDDLLDELVTGNLQGTKYREVLEALEARPHLWRKCAIAFLQEQALTQDLKALARGDIDWSPSLSPVVRTELASAMSSQRETVASSKHEQFLTLQRVGALAAMLVFSFAIGWMGAGLRGRDLAQPSAGSPVQAGIPVQAGMMGSASLANQSGDGTSGAVYEPTGNSTVLDNNLMPFDLQVPARLRELELAGKIRIETVEAIMPLQLEDGRTAIVPVQQMRVVPVIYSY